MGKCLYPRTIRREIYGKVQGITIPCGKCVECLSTRRQIWLFRLLNELKVAESCHFITLTYDDEHVPIYERGLQQLCKRDVQLFFKRLRKQFGKGIRYFLCGEYGTHTFRPHYHALIFNLPLDGTPSKIKLTQKIEKIWQKGNVDLGDTAGAAAINYCAKYIMYKDKVNDNHVQPFILTSRRPGLGSNYADSPAVRAYYHNNPDAYALTDGCKMALPRYYSTKIFNEKEMEARYYLNLKKRKDDIKEHVAHEFETKTCMQMALDDANNTEARRANELNKKKFLTKSRNTL